MLNNIKVQELNKLPKEVVKEVKAVLSAYDQVNVIYENGLYRTSPNDCIKSHYEDDYSFIGSFKKDEVFTLEEQIENYRSSFKCEPYHLLAELRQKQAEYIK